MLFESLDKIKRNAILSAILLAALGAIILLCPDVYIPTLILGAGYALIIIALVFIMDFFSSNKSMMDYLKFTGSLILVIVGICVLVFRGETIMVLACLFGFLLFLDGVRTLIHSFTYSRRSHRKAWWVLTILSLLLMAIGVMLFLNPWFGELGTLTNAVGTAVLFAAVVSGVRLIWTWPVKKEKGGEEHVG